MKMGIINFSVRRKVDDEHVNRMNEPYERMTKWSCAGEWVSKRMITGTGKRDWDAVYTGEIARFQCHVCVYKIRGLKWFQITTHWTIQWQWQICTRCTHVFTTYGWRCFLCNVHSLYCTSLHILKTSFVLSFLLALPLIHVRAHCSPLSLSLSSPPFCCLAAFTHPYSIYWSKSCALYPWQRILRFFFRDWIATITGKVCLYTGGWIKVAFVAFLLLVHVCVFFHIFFSHRAQCTYCIMWVAHKVSALT